MATTFLELCNQVLRRLNEVEVASPDFAAVRGIHSLAKDAIRNSLAKINQAEFEWPFNAAEHSVTLEKGVTEYSWPTTHKVTDWNSFQLQRDDALGVGYTRLGYIERDQWYYSHRDSDYEAGSDGRGVPALVFPSHGAGFGVTPVPNAAYTIMFRYYLNYSNLQAHNDVSRIPASFDSVIVDGAMYHMYMMRDNPESAQLSWQAFQDGLKTLQTLYINNYEYVYDTRTTAAKGRR